MTTEAQSYSKFRENLKTTKRVLKGNPNLLLGVILVSFFLIVSLGAGILDKANDPDCVKASEARKVTAIAKGDQVITVDCSPAIYIKPFIRLNPPGYPENVKNVPPNATEDQIESMRAMERPKTHISHWFGTDLMGRDVYSRTLHGGRLSLAVAATVSILVMLTAALIGIPTGYFRRVDNIVMRFMDGLMAFPSFLLAIALVAILGPSFQNVVIALWITGIPGVVRIIRSLVLTLRESQYVEAARAIGAQPARILIIHIFPQTIAPIVVAGTYIFANSILTEAGLSFLGTGIPPTTPSWGNQMGESRIYASISSWTIFFPGLMVALMVLAVNLVGDGLRDALDPKLRRRG